MRSCSRVMQWKHNGAVLLCFFLYSGCCWRLLINWAGWVSCYSTVLYAMTLGLLRHVGGEQPTRSARKL